jgi:hypothetical protein
VRNPRVPLILNKVTRNWPAALLLSFSLLIPAGLCAQATGTTGPKAAVPTGRIFSGTVMELTDRSVTVVRRVPGQQPVTREFARDDKTTVEGNLRNKARVTVRYRAADGGEFVAVHIIVR